MPFSWPLEQWNPFVTWKRISGTIIRNSEAWNTFDLDTLNLVTYLVTFDLDTMTWIQVAWIHWTCISNAPVSTDCWHSYVSTVLCRSLMHYEYIASTSTKPVMLKN